MGGGDLTNLGTSGGQRLAMDNLRELLAELERSDGPERAAIWDGVLSSLFELESMERAGADRPRFVGLCQAARRAVAQVSGAELGDEPEEEPEAIKGKEPPAGWQQVTERNQLRKGLGDFMLRSAGARRR
jgi:hypothetical protein